MQPLLVTHGLVVGRDIYLAFSPERVDPCRTDYTLRNTPKIVGDITRECTERAIALYETICDLVVPVSAPETAEMAYLFYYIFLSFYFALVNELSMLSYLIFVYFW